MNEWAALDTVAELVGSALPDYMHHSHNPAHRVTPLGYHSKGHTEQLPAYWAAGAVARAAGPNHSVGECMVAVDS